MISKKQENLLLIIWTQSLLAVGGSLFYSEVMGYTPCELCWYQRILMYPLIIIYSVGLLKKNIQMTFPGLIFSGVGVVVASYHYSVQKITLLQNTGGFCGDVPCTLQYINYLGFMTIPFMSLVAFLVIFIGHIFILKKSKS